MAARLVSIYTYKDGVQLADALTKANVHRLSEISLYALDPSFLRDVGARLGRTNEWVVVRTDGTLFVTVGDTTYDTVLHRHPLPYVSSESH